MVVDETPGLTQTLDPLDRLNVLESNDLDADCPDLMRKGSNINKVLSTPTVRNLAKQYGIDINSVRGTGKDGRVLREDVIDYAAKKEIVKDPAPLGAYSGEESQAGEDKHPGISGAYGWEFEDKAVILRYAFQKPGTEHV